LPSEKPQFVEAWTLQSVESVPQGCRPMLTPMLQIKSNVICHMHRIQQPYSEMLTYQPLTNEKENTKKIKSRKSKRYKKSIMNLCSTAEPLDNIPLKRQRAKFQNIF
jgi:hypothetical protein